MSLESKELTRVTKIAYEEYPTAVTLSIVGADKVEFKVGKMWLHHITLNLRPPYPNEWKKTIDYIIGCIEDMEVVPYENRADCEQYLRVAQNVIEAMISKLNVVADKNEIGMFNETFSNEETGITFNLKINTLF
ncbi:MAG: hypothetical protein CL582_17775 [Alteromonadaceae bacterium]|nr:hypothetical protein [Alteromonadaceae bacterium]|tara:strand:- start:164 stop:565 length:402 start_codon:yes stop_codon:yes gene_type:complete